jgi:hypothetical protein
MMLAVFSFLWAVRFCFCSSCCVINILCNESVGTLTCFVYSFIWKLLTNVFFTVHCFIDHGLTTHVANQRKLSKMLWENLIYSCAPILGQDTCLQVIYSSLSQCIEAQSFSQVFPSMVLLCLLGCYMVGDKNNTSSSPGCVLDLSTVSTITIFCFVHVFSLCSSILEYIICFINFFSSAHLNLN